MGKVINAKGKPSRSNRAQRKAKEAKEKAAAEKAAAEGQA